LPISFFVGVALSELNLFVFIGASAGVSANSVFNFSFSALIASTSSTENSTTSVVFIDLGLVEGSTVVLQPFLQHHHHHPLSSFNVRN
jgi:hypothetical protein